MNANAKLWVEALRSGKYEQGTGYLCRGGKYCCLGVAGELATEAGVINRSVYTVDDVETARFDGFDGSLSLLLRQWIGLRDGAGSYRGDSLAMLNDCRGKTFAEIADIIESEPEGLFA